MFYESLIDNMEIGKSYNINKENLIFVEKNAISELKMKIFLEKDTEKERAHISPLETVESLI